MAGEFKKRESVRKGVKRLGRRQIEKALRDLTHSDRLEAVHEVRKGIKQLRALLRLSRAVMARSDYRIYSEELRKTARHLATARDAHVKVNAMADLTGHFKDELAPRYRREIRRLLAADCHAEQIALSQKRAPRSVGRLLKKLSRRFASLELKGSGWSALAPGLKRSYRDGRRGYCRALETGTPEHLHDWRKRVKDLGYQLAMLCPIWPEQITAAEAELKDLGQSLGDDHDLFLLAQACSSKRFRKQAQQGAAALKALAAERQKQLRVQAFALGARLYEEKPSAFCKRLGQYWKRFRREPKRVLQGRASRCRSGERPKNVTLRSLTAAEPDC